MSVLIDTDVLIDGMNGRSLAVRALRELARQRTAISIVTVAELFDGAFHASDPQLHLENARTFQSPIPFLGLTNTRLKISGAFE